MSRRLPRANELSNRPRLRLPVGSLGAHWGQGSGNRSQLWTNEAFVMPRCRISSKAWNSTWWKLVLVAPARIPRPSSPAAAAGWHVPERSEGRGCFATPITSFWACHPTPSLVCCSCGIQDLCQFGFECFIHHPEVGRSWRLMWLSAGPWLTNFGGGAVRTLLGAHRLQHALVLGELPRPQRAQQRIHVAAQSQQHPPRTAHDEHGVVAALDGRCRPRQQQLQRQQRSFRFAMHQLHLPALQFHLLEHPFVVAKQTFVLPTPAIDLSGWVARP